MLCMPENSAVQPTDFEKRREEFLIRYKQLIDEFHIDFVSQPMFVPNDRGTWELVVRTELADTTEVPVRSPIQI